MKIKDQPERIVCDQSGNVLFSIKGNYKTIRLDESRQYFIANVGDSSQQESLVIYNLEGKRVFKKKFESSHYGEFIENIYFYEEAGKFMECDIVTGRIIPTEIEEIDEIRLIEPYKKMYLFKSNGKIGLYAYTNERSENDKFVGFKEIIPMHNMTR